MEVAQKVAFRHRILSIFVDFGSPRGSQNEPKCEKNACRKSCVFWHAEKTPKSRAKRAKKRWPAECARPAGRFGGVQYPAKVCMQWEIMRGVDAFDFMQDFALHLTRQQRCGGFKRYAHSADPHWMHGCLEEWN